MGGMLVSPTASRLILRAAARYRSSVDGETNSSSARLSKPLVTLSAGSSVETSNSFGRLSSASRSRTAFWYSVRLSRCSAGRRPGLGASVAARSSSVSNQPMTSSYVASSGRGRPTGGIVRASSLRMTRSHASGSPATWLGSSASSARPAMRNCETCIDGAVPRPFTMRSLWQVTQYRSSVASTAAAVASPSAGGADIAGAAASTQPDATASTTPRTRRTAGLSRRVIITSPIGIISVSVRSVHDAYFIGRSAPTGQRTNGHKAARGRVPGEFRPAPCRYPPFVRCSPGVVNADATR